MVYAQHTPAGIRIAAIKFMQKVILVQTRGVTDPRVRSFIAPERANRFMGRRSITI